MIFRRLGYFWPMFRRRPILTFWRPVELPSLHAGVVLREQRARTHATLGQARLSKHSSPPASQALGCQRDGFAKARGAVSERLAGKEPLAA